MAEIQRIKIARSNVPYKYEEHEKAAAASPTEEVSQATNNEDEEALFIKHLAGPIRKRAKKNTDHALTPKANVNAGAVKTRRQSKAAVVYDENEENDENTMNTSAG